MISVLVRTSIARKRGRPWPQRRVQTNIGHKSFRPNLNALSLEHFVCVLFHLPNQFHRFELFRSLRSKPLVLVEIISTFVIFAISVKTPCSWKGQEPCLSRSLFAAPRICDSGEYFPIFSLHSPESRVFWTYAWRFYRVVKHLCPNICICTKVFWDPKLLKTAPIPRFSQKPGNWTQIPRNCSELLVNAAQDSTEFHWVPLNLPNLPWVFPIHWNSQDPLEFSPPLVSVCRDSCKRYMTTCGESSVWRLWYAGLYEKNAWSSEAHKPSTNEVNQTAQALLSL